MEDIALQGAQFAEEAFHQLQTKFNHSINRRIPLIFYSSHLHFQQTNITPGFIPEGVGGFFEFLKGRVVIPSNGDLYQFRHVIRHELVHVFMHSKVYNVVKQNNKLDGPFPPLWFTEGIAEFWSTEWDAQAEMVLKDAVLNNYEVGLSNIYIINGTFTMYKTGQNVLEYIKDKYGEDKVLQIIENLWKHDRFEESFKEAIGVNYEEFDREYLYYLKKRYYPVLAEENFNSISSKTIVYNGFNFKPVYYNENNKEYVVFVGNRTGYSSIFMKELTPSYSSEEEVEVLIKGEASSDFEAFHIFDSKIDVSEDGVLVFTAKSGETDVLYYYDIPARKIIGKYAFEDYVGLYSPTLSPDGNRVVLSGLSKAGYKDLLIFNPQNGKLKKLTNDTYNDRDPFWSTDNNHIVFSSDRSAYGMEGFENIFVTDTSASFIRYLTYGRHKDQTPVLSYTSDQSGTYNIYILKDPFEFVNNQPISINRLTHSVGSIFDPEWTPSGSLLFGTFENRRFQIRLFEDVLDSLDQQDKIVQKVSSPKNDLWQYSRIKESKIIGNKKYEKEYDLDIVQTQVSQDPIFGTTGGAQLAFTDIMGNEQYNILIYNNARTSSELLKSFNFALTKVSLEKQVNYAYGIFRFAGEYYNRQDAFFFEDRIGGLFALSYPISQFSRVEFNQSFSYSDKDWFFRRRYAWLSSSFISFVNDNALWYYTGPIEGRRLNITFGNTYDFRYSNVNYITGLIDFRNYYRLSLRTAYAIRLMTLFNDGRETRQFYFGGSWDLRGYPRWSLYGEKLFLVSQEYRFPLVDLIGVRLPFFSIGFSQIRGALFVDAGNVWNDSEDFGDMLGSFGAGIRLPLGFLVLRWDFGKTTNFKTISDSYFTQFFFGWDF